MTGVLARSPRLLDIGIAALLLAGAVLEASAGELEHPLWLHVPLVVVVMAATAFRRRFPLSTLVFVAVGVMVVDPDGQFSTFAALVLVSFTAGVELDLPRAWWGLILAVVPFWIGLATEPLQVSDYVAVTVLYGGSWAVGQMVRQQGKRAAEEAARADRAEREREERAASAVAAERTRIARELHDIVAHSISVVAVQTQAVRRRLDPSLTREIEDLKAVETTARQAMAEMRRLFGVLRADTDRPALEPQPGLDQLDRLVADARAAGTPVDLVVEGERTALPPGLDLAAYRIVQEALTNARRHAPGTPVRVCLRFTAGGLEVAVENDGAVRPRADGGGLGLIGMRERVALYGGALEAGPTAGGFAVHATLPLREAATA